MNVFLNGQVISTEAKNLLELLKEKNIRIDFVAVEVNGRIVSRKEYEKFILKENDRIEVVRMLGGG